MLAAILLSNMLGSSVELGAEALTSLAELARTAS